MSWSQYTRLVSESSLLWSRCKRWGEVYPLSCPGQHLLWTPGSWCLSRPSARTFWSFWHSEYHVSNTKEYWHFHDNFHKSYRKTTYPYDSNSLPLLGGSDDGGCVSPCSKVYLVPITLETRRQEEVGIRSCLHLELKQQWLWPTMIYRMWKHHITRENAKFCTPSIANHYRALLACLDIPFPHSLVPHIHFVTSTGFNTQLVEVNI